MNDNLMLKQNTIMMNRLLDISGNVEAHKLSTFIWITQVTDVKRILTDGLYNKILEDFSNNDLSGDYQTIYDEYVSLMLVFFTGAQFIMKNPIMVTAGGNFKHSPQNAEVVSSAENERLSKSYRELGLYYESKFYDFMKDKNIPEYERRDYGSNDTFKFGWHI